MRSVMCFMSFAFFFCTNASTIVKNINVNHTIQADTKLLLVMPGFGFHPARSETVLHNLRVIRNADIAIHCLIYIYGHNITKSVLSHIRDYCHVQYSHPANYASYLKTVTPVMINRSGCSHVMILLDDVELTDPFR